MCECRLVTSRSEPSGLEASRARAAATASAARQQRPTTPVASARMAWDFCEGEVVWGEGAQRSGSSATKALSSSKRSPVGSRASPVGGRASLIGDAPTTPLSGRRSPSSVGSPTCSSSRGSTSARRRQPRSAELESAYPSPESFRQYVRARGDSDGALASRDTRASESETVGLELVLDSMHAVLGDSCGAAEPPSSAPLEESMSTVEEELTAAPPSDASSALTRLLAAPAEAASVAETAAAQDCCSSHL